jgi:hypothetical protein
MSCNEWEKGEWHLSCIEFRKMREAVVAGYNELQEKRYADTLKVKTEMDRLLKNDAKAEVKALLATHICNLTPTSPDGIRTILSILCERFKLESDVVRHALMQDKREVVMGNTSIPNLGTERTISVEAWVAEKNRTCYNGMGRRVDAEGKIWGNQWTDRKRPKAPKKKDFPKATKATASFRVGYEGNIHLNADKRVVTWVVSENNHAVDRAHEEPMARVFWRALRNVNWTRGTGGRLWGSDEYADDADRACGYGGDMTKEAWGTYKTEREKRYMPGKGVRLTGRWAR